MSFRINQNLSAMSAYNNLQTSQTAMSQSLERLSSGFRINRAADDAAGLSVSEGLRSQIGGLQVASRNAQDGINVVQTAEGAMNEVHSILQRMRDLSVQASNTGSQDSTARAAAQSEVTQLSAELDRIGNTTRFGGQPLLQGTPASVTTTVVPGAATTVTTGSSDTFSINAGVFKGTNGTNVDLSTTALNVTVAPGSYTNSGTYQNALQTGIDSALTGAGIAAGTIKATVTDTGTGSWTVAVSSSHLDATTTGMQFATSGSTVAGVSSTTSVAQASSFTSTFQIGANAGESMSIQFKGVNSSLLGTDSLDLVNSASAAISTIDSAIQTVSNNRANLGAYQNRFQHTINSLNVSVQNLSASESQVRDTDMAAEMVSYTKSQILSQAGTAMLAQANQAPSSVLKLLQ
jgi:flagellin